MKAILILALSLGLIIGANATCSAQVSLSARANGAYQINGVNYQIYDFSASNTGSESIINLRAILTFPSTSYIGDSWNYEKSNSSLKNFGPALLPGQIFSGAGFILVGQGPASINYASASCGGATPTQVPTPAPSGCQASYSLIRRTNGSFLENGIPSQIWDLIFRNSGTKSISEIKIAIAPAQNTVVNQNNKWNLIYNSNDYSYQVQLSGALQLAGSEFSGAGFVISGAYDGAPSISFKDLKCSN